MSRYILALDLGTTGNRAIVFDKDHRIQAQAYKEFRQFYPKPGWVEHDPEEIWLCVRSLVDQILRRVGADKIHSIGITNQRETVVAWDRRNGRSVHRAIVWQDRRTAARCAELKRRGLEARIHRKTGLRLDPYFSATKMEWLLRQIRPLHQLARTGDLALGTIDSWIAYKLTGGKSHITDTSNASRTLLFNIHNLLWDKELCKIFGVDPAWLPKVGPTSGQLAFTSASLTRRELPIAAMVGDQQGAAFAQGCYKPEVIKNTYGTGLFMVENTGSKPKFSKDLLTTVAWSTGDLRHTEYALEGSVFVGGAAVQWLRDGLKIIQRASEADKLAASVKSTDGVYFVPALVGLGAPYWDPNARGMLIGLTRGTGRAHIARAALEAIAYQSRDVMELMRSSVGSAIRKLRVDGGASVSDFLMQFQADMLGIPVERPEILETTALGAAGLAGIGSGFWKSREDFLSRRRVNRVFKPSRDRRAADLSYRAWKRAVQRTLSWIETK